MKLSKLLHNLPEFTLYGNKNAEVKNITFDSRNVKKNSLFVAYLGVSSDGHDYISKSIDLGASVVVGEKSYKSLNIPKNIAYIKIRNGRKILGLLASAFFANPSKKLKIIGVTGTDGKTTTSSLIYHILNTNGIKAGLVSTVSAKIGHKEIDTGFHVTSPDPVSLQSFLSEMVRSDCKYAVLEVTSHAMDQERFSGVVFDFAVITNVTHEHLDYHKTWTNYRNAKGKLFEETKKTAVLNLDDRSYGYFSKIVSKGVKMTTYSILSDRADYFGKNIKDSEDEMIFDLINRGSGYKLKTRLHGDYNVSNILAAVATCKEATDLNFPKIVRSVNTFTPPPGRLEEIANSKGFKIYVDFAHTPNALENVLKMLRQKTKAKLICVFGCAAERDLDKRPMMGEISSRYADISVLTAEDPRSDDVNEIIDQIAGGINKKKAERSEIYKIPERGEAISFAIQKLAAKGDIIVICGKGHEKSMAYNGIEYPWSDKEAVEIALKGGVKEIKR